MMMISTPRTDITATPTFGELIRYFFTGAPILPPTVAGAVSVVRSVVMLLLVDTLSYFANLLTTGQPISAQAIFTVLVPELLYVLIQAIQKYLAATMSPLDHLVTTADTLGVKDMPGLLSPLLAAPAAEALLNTEAPINPTVNTTPDVPLDAAHLATREPLRRASALRPVDVPGVDPLKDIHDPNQK